MALDSQVISKIKRILKRRILRPASVALSLICAVLLVQPILTYAAPTAPTLLGSEWRTGEIEVQYTGVQPDHLVAFYAAKWDDPDNYKLYDIWLDDGSGSHVVQFLENGQTHWFYITQVHPTDG